MPAAGGQLGSLEPDGRLQHLAVQRRADGQVGRRVISTPALAENVNPRSGSVPDRRRTARTTTGPVALLEAVIVLGLPLELLEHRVAICARRRIVRARRKPEQTADTKQAEARIGQRDRRRQIDVRAAAPPSAARTPRRHRAEIERDDRWPAGRRAKPSGSLSSRSAPVPSIAPGMSMPASRPRIDA